MAPRVPSGTRKLKNLTVPKAALPKGATKKLISSSENGLSLQMPSRCPVFSVSANTVPPGVLFRSVQRLLLAGGT